MIIWMMVSVQLLRHSNGAPEMDNEFAEFEDMEVEDMSDQEVTLKLHREASKTTGDKSAVIVIFCLMHLLKLLVPLY